MIGHQCGQSSNAPIEIHSRWLKPGRTWKRQSTEQSISLTRSNSFVVDQYQIRGERTFCKQHALSRSEMLPFGPELNLRKICVFAVNTYSIDSSWERNSRRQNQIREIVDDFPDLSDDGILSLMAAVFDRPAFRTPFELECSLPAFQQAIEDTISALSTGIWKTRDGTEIRRLPSLHHIKDKDVRKGVMRTVRQVDELRRIFVRRLRDGSITHCNCGDANCPTFMLQPGVSVQFDAARSRALETFRLVYPQFAVVVR